jgi:PAS domain S-box-containing protein
MNVNGSGDALATELRTMRTVQGISTELISESDPQALYTRLLDAALVLMRCAAASLHLLEPDGTIRLGVSQNLNSQTDTLALVDTAFASASAQALERKARVIIPDLEAWQVVDDPGYIYDYRRTGIRAMQSTPLITVNGRPVGIISTYWRHPHNPTENELAQLDVLGRQAADLIDRSRAEAALRESEDRLRQALSIQTVGVLFFHLDGRLLDANPALERMTGWPIEELRAIKDWRILTPPEFRDATERAFTELVQHGRTDPYEKQWIRKDGSRMWGLFAPTRVKGRGRDAECAEFIVDITRGKEAERTLEFLSDISRDLEHLTNIAETMEALGEKIGRHLNASRCSFIEISEATGEIVCEFDWHHPGLPSIVGVYRIDAYLTNEEFLRCLRGGDPFETRDVRADPRVDANNFAALGILSFMTVPLVRDGQLQFALSIYDESPRDWRREEIELLRELTTRIWNHLERARAEAALRSAHDELERRVQDRTADLAHANTLLEGEVSERRAGEAQIKSLFERLVSIQEEERRRIARDLHDQLGQQLTALRMNLEVARIRMDGDPAMLAQAQRTQQLAEDLDRSIDFLTWELRPAALDHLGLSAALEGLVTGWAQRFEVAADFNVLGAEGIRLPLDVEGNLYRIVQEALHNVVKHANATHVTVFMEYRGSEILVVIEDNGKGFDTAVFDDGHHKHLGLVGMRERAVLAGGRLEIESTPGTGSAVIVRIPQV